MRGRREIDWKAVASGLVAYEQPFAALDGERFERIERGFGGHYQVERVSSDAFSFARGEGYSRLPRWDAFSYVDHGMVERVRADEAEFPDLAENVAVLPAGWRAIRFRLDIRVTLVFWGALIAGIWFVAVPDTPGLLWIGVFIAIWAAHVAFVMRSLDAKLARWMAKSSWN